MSIFVRHAKCSSAGAIFSAILLKGSCPEKHRSRRIEEIRATAEDFQKEIAMHVLAGIDYRKFVFVNCWHMSEYESGALWRLYLKSDEGIAIQSTRSDMHSSLQGQNVWTLPVRYIDYADDDPAMPTRMAAFRFKRKCFEHERELRAIVYLDVQGEAAKPPDVRGISIDVDLDQLIAAVYVAPTAPDWLLDLTARVSLASGVKAPVLRSSLAGDDSLFI